MAKKHNTPQRNNGPAPVKATPNVQRPQQPAAKKPAAEQSVPFVQKYMQPLIMAGIALVTFLFYRGAFSDKFTNWDDLGYVLTNPLIKDSSWEGIKKIFDVANPVMGNYHPVTIVSYVWEYKNHGLEPFIYHFDSVLIHIACTLVIYGFVKVLTRRTVAAAIAALFFGLHPMHVESVTWIAGRKDLIYGSFYMLSCIAYLYFVRDQGGKKWLWYISAMILFGLSLLAKSVGVTLPVVLLLLDYFEDRKWTIAVFAEKIPFFGLSLLFGLLSIHAQKDVGALGTLDVSFTALERFALGCYGLFTYMWKTIAPVGLTNFYPYPMKVNDSLPATFYIYPAIILGMVFAVWRFARHNRIVVFGLAFFVINLLLLLQFLPVGGAIMSDRYTYIPYAGLFLIVGWYVSNYFESKEKQQTGKLLLGACLAYALAFGFMTNERNKDWYDSVTLWKDAIEKDPQSPIGYFYLGQEYYTRFESATTPADRASYGDSAYFFFTKSVERKPDYASPIICIGEYLRSIGKIDEAKKNYLRAIQISDKSESAYLGLGVVYSIKQQYDSAGPTFRKALSLKKYFPEGHSNYANFLDITGKVDSALIEYAYSISQNPDAYIPYMNRARIYLRLNKLNEAIADYSRAMVSKPDMPEPYYLRAQALAKLGKKADALQDVQTAKEKGYPQIDPAFVQSLR